MGLKIDKVSSDIRVVDNLLPEEVFKPLQHWFTEGCRWQYCPYILGDGEDTDPDAYQFVHMFWDPCLGVVSPDMDRIYPLIEVINPHVWLRIQANLNPKKDKVEVRDFHTDVGPYNHVTSIYYINTCDGCTNFEDGTKVESVANRLLTFPSNKRHSGTACSDAKARIVLNLNYFPNRL